MRAPRGGLRLSCRCSRARWRARRGSLLVRSARTSRAPVSRAPVDSARIARRSRPTCSGARRIVLGCDPRRAGTRRPWWGRWTGAQTRAPARRRLVVLKDCAQEPSGGTRQRLSGLLGALFERGVRRVGQADHQPLHRLNPISCSYSMCWPVSISVWTVGSPSSRDTSAGSSFSPAPRRSRIRATVFVSGWIASFSRAVRSGQGRCLRCLAPRVQDATRCLSLLARPEHRRTPCWFATRP